MRAKAYRGLAAQPRAGRTVATIADPTSTPLKSSPASVPTGLNAPPKSFIALSQVGFDHGKPGYANNSHLGDSNPRPMLYESIALPLS